LEPWLSTATIAALETTIFIESIAYGGAGVGRLPDGRVCFVHGTLPGERARVKITKEKKNHAEADVLSLLEASPRRVAPPCPVYGECGGCAYQHAAYALQLEIKTTQVSNVLRRIGGISGVDVRPMIASPLEWRYRNRISVHVQDRKVGFYHRKSHHLVDVESCPLATDKVNDMLADLRSGSRRESSRITLREPNAPFGFTQVNEAAAELLAGVVVEMSGSGLLLVDAYCGAGFFSKKMLGFFEKVIGIEWSQAAVQLARENADEKEIYHAGSVENMLPGVISSAPPEGTSLIIDPPAEGLSPDAARTILEHPPATLVYVSCDPATFSRDAKKLSASYRLVRIQPVDMFPQTAEIELAAKFERL
jgi:23S rRNA (uracil1939-C5)-methyltransferase